MKQKRARVRLDPEVRKRQILDVAADLFVERGFEAVDIADIAAQAEVSRAAIYKYFPSTEAILKRLLEGAIAEVLADLTPLMERSTFSGNASDFEEIFATLLRHPRALRLIHSGGGPIFRKYRQYFLFERLTRQLEVLIPKDRPPHQMLIFSVVLEALAFEVTVQPDLDAGALGKTLATLLTKS